MGRRKIEDKSVRKLSKTGGKSIYVVLPIAVIRELKWKAKQKVVVKKRGNGILISDWKK